MIAGAYAALGLLCAILYLPALQGEFLLDDLFTIVHNPILADAGRWHRYFHDPAALSAAPGLSSLIWRPLLGLSYAVNRALTGPGAAGFHAHDILVHAANAALIALLSRRWTGPGLHNWLAAALFAAHPAQAQAVAYAGSRPSTLSVLFGLSCLWAWVSGGRLRRLALPAYSAALLTKESSVFWLPVLWLADRMRPPSTRARSSASGLLPLVAATGAYAACRWLVLGQFAQRGPWGGSWETHAPLAVHGLFKTASLAVWPVGLREPYGFLLGPRFALESGGMALAFVGIMAAAFFGCRRGRVWGFGLAWFLLGLAPVSNVVPFGALAADRYLYAPLAGLCLAAADLLRRRPGRAAALAAVLPWACLHNISAQLAWRSGFGLALEARHEAPWDPYPGLRLAAYYSGWGMLGHAEPLALAALRPDVAQEVRLLAYKRLALIHARAGRAAEAVAVLKTSLAENPRQRSAWRMLGQLARAAGDPDLERRAAIEADKSRP